MVPKKSLFQFDDFVILNFTYNFVPSKKQIVNPKEFTDKYPIDVDFTFQKNSNKTMMLCKISINQSNEPLPGYSLFVEGLGIFDPSIAADFQGQEHVINIQFPAVSYGITQIRNIILLLTSQGPFGKYQLPLFSAADLFNKKAKNLEKKKATPDSKEKGTPS